MPKNVWLLTLIQALAMSSGTMMVLVGGVLGAKLAPSSELSTLPVALMIVGTAIGVFPVTRLMGRLGRKPVFVFMSLLAMCASGLAATAAINSHFYGFILSTFFIGISASGFQQIRFAAMESVRPEKMPKAASTVLLGGLVAAIIGPEIATSGRSLLGAEFAGTFIIMGGICFICAVLFLFFKETHVKQPKSEESNQSISHVFKHPLFIVAVSSSVIGYALMSFIMTATPVHMHVMEHHSLEHTKWVIQSHIIAMFLPSFISGWLITKLGVKKVIIMGLGAYLCTILFGLLGNELINYWTALILLGIGWNFLFLGGTVLLPRTYNVHQKIRVQSFNELAVFTAQAMAALGAGAMLFLLGWQGLLLTSLIIVMLQISVLYWQSVRMKRPGFVALGDAK